jgi:hypothetical protein
MGMPSYQADIEDKAADNRAMAGLFAHGTAGAAGISTFLEIQRAATAMRRAQRTETEARRRKEQARRTIDDALAWQAATADVQPLRRR